MDQFETRMESVKETKGCFVFKDTKRDDGELELGTLYVPKSVLKALGSKGDIVVTIKSAPRKQPTTA